MAKGMNPIQSRAVVKLKLPLAGVLTLAAMIVMSLPAGAAGLGVARPVISSKIAAAAPGLVDLGAVRTAHKGDVIALGRLVDASGNAASGMVAALALPGDKIEKSLKVGDSVPWPTIGAAATAADGTFTIQADSGSVPPGYWQNGKVVNVKLIGWNESSQGTWTIPAEFGSTDGSSAQPVELRLDQPRTDAAPSVGSRADATANVVNSGSPCRPPRLLSTYVAVTNVAESQPRYGSSEFSIYYSHTVKVGVASKVGSGAWQAGGTYSTTAGVTISWSPSGAKRVYQVDIRYGIWASCGIYDTHPIGPTGGNHAPSDITRTWCGYGHIVPVSAGSTFKRNTTSGSAFHLSGGVDASPYIGIDLSSDDQYSTQSELQYHFDRNTYLCGSNADPSVASRMNEYP